MSIQLSSPYNRIFRLTESSGTLVIAFLWGLAEATLFFLVPDIFLGFVAIFNWRRGILATGFVIAGALVGGTIMYVLASNQAVAMDRLLTSIPLINEHMVSTVGEEVGRSGLSAMVTGPFQGIPYKIYAAQAGQHNLPYFLFLLVTILARLERILPVVLLGSITGKLFRKFIQIHTLLVVGGYLVFWVGIYVLYYLRFR